MNRRVIAFGIVFFVLLASLFGLSYFVVSIGKQSFKSVVYNSQVIPYGYSHLPGLSQETILTGVVVDKDLKGTSPHLVVATSPLSIQMPVNRITVALSLEDKQTLFAEQTEERQTDFFYTSYSEQELERKLSDKIPVSIFYSENSKIPYLVMIQTYLK